MPPPLPRSSPPYPPPRLRSLALVLASSTSASFADVTVPTYKLRDGNSIPKMGLGVYRSRPGNETYASVLLALETGYRHIDTAVMYENEASVGRAVLDSGIPREDVYITTKLDANGHGYDEALAQVEESLRRLRTDYVDLLLMHSPYGGVIVETWDAMIKLKADGKVRSIGVSNFGYNHLEAIRRTGRPLPAVNQIEMHPLIYPQRAEFVQYCRESKIHVTAYGSLLSGKVERYDDPPLPSVARAHGRTVPQVLLRWALHLGFSVIPKSSGTEERMRENFAVMDFDLRGEELRAISEMGTRSAPLGAYWNPLESRVDVGDLSRGIEGTARSEAPEL